MDLTPETDKYLESKFTFIILHVHDEYTKHFSAFRLNEDDTDDTVINNSKILMT